MFKIKQIPSDFIVNEINTLNFDKSGSYSYYTLKKTSYNTIDAIKRVSDSWNINEKYFNFAGIKDKNAITTQYISINHGPEKDLILKDLELKFIGKGKERISLGFLEKNYFEITIRNIRTKPVGNALIVNYFDEQRFGTNNNNHVVGKLILKGDYEKACSMIKETRSILDKEPNNFISALRSLPKRVLKLYVRAYQSHLWNMTAEELSKTEKKNIKLPILGFGTEFSNKKVESIYEKIMKKENIDLRDFINKKIPDLSEEGTERELYVTPENLQIGKLEDDELNEGMKKILVRFYLPPGAYATNVVKSMFKAV